MNWLTNFVKPKLFSYKIKADQERKFMDKM